LGHWWEKTAQLLFRPDWADAYLRMAWELVLATLLFLELVNSGQERTQLGRELVVERMRSWQKAQAWLRNQSLSTIF
jgi:hypothetical protein